ncbi:hypothetical protein GQ44DRAFT_698157 [Phaeosphaeriaceae sp. PMI808]|nr:hypothetical protein GQ44DRAFT_698157 [Phaeosphaeriaceae sp. PMI808]
MNSHIGLQARIHDYEQENAAISMETLSEADEQQCEHDAQNVERVQDTNIEEQRNGKENQQEKTQIEGEYELLKK